MDTISSLLCPRLGGHQTCLQKTNAHSCILVHWVTPQLAIRNRLAMLRMLDRAQLLFRRLNSSLTHCWRNPLIHQDSSAPYTFTSRVQTHRDSTSLSCAKSCSHHPPASNEPSQTAPQMRYYSLKEARFATSSKRSQLCGWLTLFQLREL